MKKNSMMKPKNLLGESRVILYRSRGSVVDFAALLSRFKLFVSTSTGTYHLASAAGCETFTFFGDSRFASALRWKSIGEESKQHHFMIPLDPVGRAEMFERVKQELKNRLLSRFLSLFLKFLTRLLASLCRFISAIVIASSNPLSLHIRVP